MFLIRGCLATGILILPRKREDTSAASQAPVESRSDIVCIRVLNVVQQPPSDLRSDLL